MSDFKFQIQQGIPNELPPFKELDNSVSHAPKRKAILSKEEEKLALKNALRYFDKKHHPVLPALCSDDMCFLNLIRLYIFSGGNCI